MNEIMAKILGDSALAARYRALEKNDTEGFAALVQDAGFELTAKQIAELQNADGELTEEDLRQVAAGFKHPLCGAQAFHG